MSKCVDSNAKLFPNYDARFRFQGKTGQSLLFKEIGSPYPKTIHWNSSINFRNSCSSSWPHKLPFLIKTDNSHEGEGVMLIKDHDTLDYSLTRLFHSERSEAKFITQELIQSGGNVLRVVVIGGKIFSYWKRPEKSGEIITTISSGAKIDKVWKKELQALQKL